MPLDQNSLKIFLEESIKEFYANDRILSKRKGYVGGELGSPYTPPVKV